MEEGAAASMTGEKRVAIDVPANGHGAAEPEEKAAEDLPPAPPALSGWPRSTGLYLFVMNIRFVPCWVDRLSCAHVRCLFS
jgi:hypothetical protein